MPSPPPQPIDATTERLIEATFERRPRALPPRERATEAGFAAILLAAALALALLAEPARALSAPLALLFVAVYVAVHRVEFQIGDGNMVPTQIVFVPMLLLLPTPVVPLLVSLAAVCASGAETLRRRRSPERMLMAFNDAGFALAPAMVLIALGAQTPEWSSWPAYVAALAAQFVADGIRETARSAIASAVPARVVIAELTQAHRVDAMLAPVGLLAAIAAAGVPVAALLVLPLVALLAVFAREREARIAQTIELGHAYRGTALLLRDLLEQEDEYTGHHTEDVVELSLRVAETIGVSEDVRREIELGALLHDIGKIHIPNEIINKPGKLDADEWALMKTHTIEGQKMLDQVGGMLSSVGIVVRASHERYDGGGYPDGLAGEAIPLAASIVAACDSFNAMTTTRSYRRAMPVATAVEELHRCSGTQFDPTVVTALVAVVRDPGWLLALREPAAKPAQPAAAYSSAAYASARNSGSVARKPSSSSAGIVTVTPVT